MGEYRLIEDLTSDPPAAYLELVGDYAGDDSNFEVGEGVVQKVTFAPRKGLSRLSLIFRKEFKPQKVVCGLAVKDGRLAIAFKIENGPKPLSP
jgi:hypothetical protein